MRHIHQHLSKKKKNVLPQYQSSLHMLYIHTVIPCVLSTHARTDIARLTHPTDGSTGNPHSRGRSDHCFDETTEKNVQAFSGLETTCGQCMQVSGIAFCCRNLLKMQRLRFAYAVTFAKQEISFGTSGVQYFPTIPSTTCTAKLLRL